MRHLNKRLTLARFDPRETASPSVTPFYFKRAPLPEHSNLVDNVIPVSRRVQLLRQQSVQLMTHCNNALGHGPDIPPPFLE